MDEEEEWTKISTDGLYTPGEADVGHCLRLECRAVLPTGEEVCTPRVITTEPVLSSESVWGYWCVLCLALILFSFFFGGGGGEAIGRASGREAECFCRDGRDRFCVGQTVVMSFE